MRLCCAWHAPAPLRTAPCGSEVVLLPCGYLGKFGSSGVVCFVFCFLCCQYSLIAWFFGCWAACLVLFMWFTQVGAPVVHAADAQLAYALVAWLVPLFPLLLLYVNYRMNAGLLCMLLLMLFSKYCCLPCLHVPPDFLLPSVWLCLPFFLTGLCSGYSMHAVIMSLPSCSLYSM